MKNWKYSIDIKSKFTEVSDNAIIKSLSQDLISQLTKIKVLLPTIKFKEDGTLNYISNTLTGVVYDFVMLVGLCNDDSDGDDIDNNEQTFNEILSDLYDLGDTKYELKSGMVEKLICIH